MRKVLTDLERFEASIRKTESGCWEWQKAEDKDGYGLFKVGSRCDGTRKSERVHRWSYKQFRGPIPVGLQIDHLCRNRRCANPDHLDVVTALENTRRGWRKNKSACKSGHALAGRNLYICPSTGRRACAICRRRWVKEHYTRTNGAAQKRYAEANREKRRIAQRERRANWTEEQKTAALMRGREYDSLRRLGRRKSA